MQSTDPKFQQMIAEIQSFIGRRVEKEWTDLFGSAVMVTVPRSSDDFDVAGWVNSKEVGTKAEDLLPACLFNLCVTLMMTEQMHPADVHGVVMQAAVKAGKALIIDADDSLDGMTKN